MKPRWIVHHFVQPGHALVHCAPVLLWSSACRFHWYARLMFWLGNLTPPNPFGDVCFATMRPAVAGVDYAASREHENACPEGAPSS